MDAFDVRLAPRALQQTDLEEIARQVKAASTSFYGAMRILPKTKRQAIFAVYAFCREVDDIADEDFPLEDKHRQLSEWRREIDRIYNGDPQSLIGRALAEAMQHFPLRQIDLLAVVDGMEMDAQGPIIAPDAATLDLYCDRVACAVGRLCVCIFGEANEQGYAVATDLGMALQKTNILRDVDEDVGIGRLYLPKQALVEAGIDWTDLNRVTQQAGYPALWRKLAQQAETHFQNARTSMANCNPRDMRPARIMMEVYHLNLRRMREMSDQELADPAVSKRLVGKFEKLFIALRFGLF